MLFGNHKLFVVKPLVDLDPCSHLLLLLNEPVLLVNFPSVHAVHQLGKLFLWHMLRLKSAAHHVVLEHY